MPRLPILATILCVLVCPGCDDPVRPPEPDVGAPVIAVLSPTVGVYDEDGDALVDLRLSWTDSAGSMDRQSVRVRTLRDGTGSATPGHNLMSEWRVERMDSVGLLIHETFNALLPHGANLLEITVADTAGNVIVDTIAFDLPYAAVTKTLDSGSREGHIVEAIYCADDNRIYMTAGDNVIAVDPDSLRITADLLASKAGAGARDVLCFEDEESLYVSGTTVMLYHRTTHENTADILGAYPSRAMKPSRVDPDLRYVGHVGFLLGQDGSDALASAVQYGVRRSPPASAESLWLAQRLQGVHLLDGRLDVQFIISASERSGTGSYRLTVVEGDDLASLRAAAEVVSKES